MSIIYDALKKIQDKQGNGLLKDVGRKSSVKPRAKPGSKTFHKLLLPFLLLALALGFSARHLFLYLKQEVRPIQKQVEKQEYTRPLEPASSNVMKPLIPEAVSDIPSLTLNGIVVTESGNGALINDEILMVGDLIEGARVLEINSKDVLLDYNGRKISLRMK